VERVREVATADGGGAAAARRRRTAAAERERGMIPIQTREVVSNFIFFDSASWANTFFVSHLLIIHSSSSA
jgi:hypothetical protein